MFRTGFSGMGINEVLQAAEVSRGSFYHHFKSKEGLGLELLTESYRTCFSGLENVLQVQPVELRHSCFMQWMAELLEKSCEPLRLIALLSAEVDRLPEGMRAVLVQHHEQTLQLLTACIESIPVRVIPPENGFRHLASALLSLWIGAGIISGIQADACQSEGAWLSATSMLMEAGSARLTDA